ncbi:hypothetical protein CEXT_317831 [Caerostris extrusa]|uniref:Uncharacterized protein n=1 Tax=Caerostris extrusa TaxID=172846 RepID=A0AAV4WZT3_CAEEX|nr:hypothetical protein CEXT_317831 [Caerostris extrusa]
MTRNFLFVYKELSRASVKESVLNNPENLFHAHPSLSLTPQRRGSPSVKQRDRHHAYVNRLLNRKGQKLIVNIRDEGTEKKTSATESSINIIEDMQ